jgi:hypothetical protein
MLILGMIVTSSLVQRIPNVNLYLVPFCLLPVIVRSFFDSRLALFAHIVGLIIVGFEAPKWLRVHVSAIDCGHHLHLLAAQLAEPFPVVRLHADCVSDV